MVGDKCLAAGAGADVEGRVSIGRAGNGEWIGSLEAIDGGGAGAGDDGGVKTVLNVIWLVLAGFWMALGYVLAGIVCVVLIITIPFGIASFRLAGYALWPFGNTVVPDPAAGAPSVVGNVLWFLLAGWWLFLLQVGLGIAYCLTIIGIPFGIACFKLARLSLNPLGKRIVPVQYAPVARAGL